jgi:glutamate racemase
MTVIDPAPAVARQTARVLAQEGLEADRPRAGDHVFCTTGDTANFTLLLERLLPTSVLLGNCTVRAACWREGRLELGE